MSANPQDEHPTEASKSSSRLPWTSLCAWIAVATTLSFWAYVIVFPRGVSPPPRGSSWLHEAAMLAIVIGGVWATRRLAGTTWSDLGFRGVRTNLVGHLAVLAIALLAFSLAPWVLTWADGAERQELLGKLEHAYRHDHAATFRVEAGGRSVGRWLAAILSEEILYRSLWLGWMQHRLRHGTAIAISAAIFGGAHVWVYGYAANPMFFVAGAVFGWMFVRHRSMLASLGAHATWDLVSAFMAWLVIHHRDDLPSLGG